MGIPRAQDRHELQLQDPLGRELVRQKEVRLDSQLAQPAAVPQRQAKEPIAPAPCTGPGLDTGEHTTAFAATATAISVSV
jgi:hypothetical protein